MSDSERIPVAFWFHDKKVNGILVKQHGEEKLTLYKNRYYIVTKEIPAKKHYTTSNLPVFWRKLMAGEVPSEPKQSPAPRIRRKDKDAVEEEQGASPTKAGVLPTAPVAPPEKKIPRRRQAAPPKERQKKGDDVAAPTVAPTLTVEYLCPYCRTKHSCQAAAKSPFFEKCLNCGKEFGVKIVPKVSYVAEVAAFK